MGEFEGTTKRLNPQIMTIKEGYHSKGIQNIFSKIREDHFPNLKKNYLFMYKRDMTIR